MIVPGQLRMLWVVVPLVLVVLGTVSVLAYTLSAARTARFEVSPSGLRLRGDFYGRVIPARELQPVARTGDTAVPGYGAAKVTCPTFVSQST